KEIIVKEIDTIDNREELNTMNPNDSLRRLSLKNDLSQITLKEAHFGLKDLRSYGPKMGMGIH
ncbi:hypothetical protein Csa_023697, partial [Cucumis sativus]